MAREFKAQVTGNELQAMVNEGRVGLRPGQSIPATNRCLTRKEVADRVYCSVGDSYRPNGGFIPYSDLGNNTIGVSPNYTCNFEYIDPLYGGDLQFEMSQEANPYLNVDLFGFLNNNILRLDPANNLDGMFFGSPQYSPTFTISSGAHIYVQANFGLINPEGAGNYGWNAPGYGFLEVSANGSLINNQQIFKSASFTSNLQSLSYSFTMQPNTHYYVKAYSLITYE